MHGKIFRALFRRRILVAFLLCIQIVFIIWFIAGGSHSSAVVENGLIALSLVVTLHIAGKRSKDAFKLIWIILVLIFPVFGGTFYLLLNYQGSTRRFRDRIERLEQASRPQFLMRGDMLERAMLQAPEHAPKMRYLQQYAGFPVYGNTATTYLSPGDEMIPKLLEALNGAEKYIFLEYFIIRQGAMWNNVLRILKKKVESGVEVRVIYDDVGCFLKLPQDYPKTLADMGIRCAVFNPFRPLLTATQNNRDHRKIAVIDGKIAFTGGVNLADEYINVVERFGHWKDAAIKLEGAAAWSFALMFLQMWAVCVEEPVDYSKYYPWDKRRCDTPDDGLVQPYADSPMDQDSVSEHVYLQIINTAKRYVYINTPYLIVDGNMSSALRLAAKSGVDVRIVTPNRWDKWAVHMTTRSYYRELIAAGVKIYEYTAGFIHSKTFLSDGEVATVGTSNLDFRSLYHHFECGVWMYKSDAVTELHKDFLKTLKRCRRITEQDCKCGHLVRLAQDILRIFAPLM